MLLVVADFTIFQTMRPNILSKNMTFRLIGKINNANHLLTSVCIMADLRSALNEEIVLIISKMLLITLQPDVKRLLDLTFIRARMSILGGIADYISSVSLIIFDASQSLKR